MDGVIFIFRTTFVRKEKEPKNFWSTAVTRIRNPSDMDVHESN